MSRHDAARRRRREQGAFFGRRKGKTLRAGVMRSSSPTLLPALRLDPRRAGAPDPRDAVSAPCRRGPSRDRLRRRRASAPRAPRERPDVGFIGCEAFINGMAKLLAHAERAGLDNIRLWDDDAKAVVDWLPEASIARAYILYPDPWPKRRHRKRRFVSARHAAAAGAGAEARRRAVLRHRHRRLRGLCARPLRAGQACSSGRRKRAGDWQRPGTAGSRRATRSRRCARGGCPAT